MRLFESFNKEILFGHILFEDFQHLEVRQEATMHVENLLLKSLHSVRLYVYLTVSLQNPHLHGSKDH